MRLPAIGRGSRGREQSHCRPGYRSEGGNRNGGQATKGQCDLTTVEVSFKEAEERMEKAQTSWFA